MKCPLPVFDRRFNPGDALVLSQVTRRDACARGAEVQRIGQARYSADRIGFHRGSLDRQTEAWADLNLGQPEIELRDAKLLGVVADERCFKGVLVAVLQIVAVVHSNQCEPVPIRALRKPAVDGGVLPE